jgi:hypothetical protein
MMEALRAFETSVYFYELCSAPYTRMLSVIFMLSAVRIWYLTENLFVR